MVYHGNTPTIFAAKTATCGNIPPGLHGSISHGNIHVDYGGAKLSGKINIGHHNGAGNLYVCPTAPTGIVHPTAPIITGGFNIPF